MDEKQLEMTDREHDMTAAETGSEEAAAGYRKIEKAVVTGYKKIEDGVVTGYKKIETGAVEGFGKVVDKCVELLFAQEGESVEDAKKRLRHKKEM